MSIQTLFFISHSSTMGTIVSSLDKQEYKLIAATCDCNDEQMMKYASTNMRILDNRLKSFVNLYFNSKVSLRKRIPPLYAEQLAKEGFHVIMLNESKYYLSCIYCMFTCNDKLCAKGSMLHHKYSEALKDLPFTCPLLSGKEKDVPKEWPPGKRDRMLEKCYADLARHFTLPLTCVHDRLLLVSPNQLL
jgi:hypothetical protein